MIDLKTTFLLVGLVLGISISCSSDSSESLEISSAFQAQVKSLVAYPGHNRVKLHIFLEDEKVDYCALFRNGSNDSIVIRKDEIKDGIAELIVEGLEEGSHTFEARAYDQQHNPSAISVVTQGKAYGDKYISTLSARAVKDKIFITGKNPVLEWSDARDNEVALRLFYTDKEGKDRRLDVKSGQQSVTMGGYQENSDIDYYSMFLPEPACIDTFYSGRITIPAPTYYSSISIKNVVEKSGLVNEVSSQSASYIHEDVEYSSLQFKKANNEPLSIFVLEANLAGGRVTLSPLMPDNGTEFKLQTVKAMAEHRDNATGKVLAAANADFFEYTGLPLGPVVINGTVIKDYLKNEGNTYFGITTEGAPIIGYFSSSINLTRFKEMVGGGSHWLVVNGNNGAWSGDTKEPRTAVGYSRNNTVYLVVVDGRNSTYSVGVELTDLALIMKSLGTYQAINLDGGGSSTMVIKENNGFQIINRYSDASPRTVANGLAILTK